jgi:PhnB protein
MKTAIQKPVKSIPEGYTMVTPWIISKNSARLIRFLTNVFGAEEKPNSRVYNKDGSIGHVEVRMKDAMVLLFDSKEGWPETADEELKQSNR